MAATLVLMAAAICVLFGIALTVYGLVQIGSGRRARSASAASPTASASAASAARAAPPASDSAGALASTPALIHFEDHPPVPAEPGVLLNTLWEHLTTAECQQGECGGCRLRLLQGEVRWIRDPQAAVNKASEILACSCEPIGSVRCARP